MGTLLARTCTLANLVISCLSLVLTLRRCTLSSLSLERSSCTATWIRSCNLTIDVLSYSEDAIAPLKPVSETSSQIDIYPAQLRLPNKALKIMCHWYFI